VAVLSYGKLQGDKFASVSYMFIDMELCDFDLDAAIVNRQLLLLTTTPEDNISQGLPRVSVKEEFLSSERELGCLEELVKHITQGVIFMHGLGEVHRDLKPANGTTLEIPY
jgi:serine/threonine protein kinase